MHASLATSSLSLSDYPRLLCLSYTPLPYTYHPVVMLSTTKHSQPLMKEEEEQREEEEEEEEEEEKEEEERLAQPSMSLVPALSQKYNPMRNSSPSCQSNKSIPLQVRCSGVTVSHSHSDNYYNNV